MQIPTACPSKAQHGIQETLTNFWNGSLRHGLKFDQCKVIGDRLVLLSLADVWSRKLGAARHLNTPRIQVLPGPLIAMLDAAEFKAANAAADCSPEKQVRWLESHLAGGAPS